MLILFPEHNDASADMTAGGIAKSAVHEAAREAARIAMDKLADHVGIKTASAGQEQKVAWQKPKDWAYMEQSGKVLKDLPETWKAYAQDEAGRMAIIKMEYAELMKAQTPEEISHELVHLGSATLHLWRLLNNAE